MRAGVGSRPTDRPGGDHRIGAGRPGAGRRARDADRRAGGVGPHRSRRVATRTATKNQLLGQLDRAFPGLTLALPDVLGTKIGRLVAAEFADPARLSALGVNRLIRFAAVRDVQLRRAGRRTSGRRGPRCVADPRRRGGPPRAGRRRGVVGRPGRPDRECRDRTGRTCCPRARSHPDLVPGWGVVRVSNYAAALGDPDRWPGSRQIYRASGLSPMQYESAGKRRDGTISREGSVALRRALIDLGIGLWLTDAAAKAYAHRPASTRQARRGHRLRPGPPRPTASPPSPWSATTRRLRPRPAGPRPRAAEKGNREHPSQPRSAVPGWKDDEGPDQMPSRLWRTHRVTPRLAWHPALRLHGSPNDAR